MTHGDHRHLDAAALLRAMEQAQLAKGRSQQEVDESRAAMRALGRSDSSIASFEFAELRLFADMDSPVAGVGEAALKGTPSEVTTSLADRDGYCPNCVRHWFAELAAAFRQMARDRRI